MTPLRPILSTLRRHKTAAALIVLEIALTCAIVCNAVFLIVERIDRAAQGSGVAESELVYLGTSSIGAGRNVQAITREDLARMRAIPGVRGAAVVNELPFGQQATITSIDLAPNQPVPTVEATLYSSDEALLGTMGLQLVAGRNFEAAEVQSQVQGQDTPSIPSAILTRALADRLFPDGHALGRAVYIFGPQPVRVVGIVQRLVTPAPRGNPADELAMIVPLRPSYADGVYLLRVEPAQRDAALAAAQAVLTQVDPRRVEQQHGRFDELRAGYYRSDVAMIALLAGVCVALLVVTAFGIVGLASFWVQQRTRMIGTRRALGATRGQILRYFQLENLLLTSAGIAVGMLGAFGINQWLMTQYELPRLPVVYLPLGALVLWALGQVAVWSPARRAANVPPAYAMRSA